MEELDFISIGHLIRDLEMTTACNFVLLGLPVDYRSCTCEDQMMQDLVMLFVLY